MRLLLDELPVSWLPPWVYPCYLRIPKHRMLIDRRKQQQRLQVSWRQPWELRWRDPFEFGRVSLGLLIFSWLLQRWSFSMLAALFKVHSETLLQWHQVFPDEWILRPRGQMYDWRYRRLLIWFFRLDICCNPEEARSFSHFREAEGVALQVGSWFLHSPPTSYRHHGNACSSKSDLHRRQIEILSSRTYISRQWSLCHVCHSFSCLLRKPRVGNRCIGSRL